MDEYSNGISKLNNAVLDAIAFRDCLLEQYQFEAIQATLETLIAEGALGETLAVLKEIVARGNSQHRLLIQLAANYSQYQKTKMAGTASAEQLALQERQLSQNLIGFVGRLKERHLKE